tara:strand:+ start:39176 stop:40069 length:894 start_codon:yes stop_codon:yes gene_type:complete
MTSTQQPDTARLMRWATYASVATAIVLIVTKIGAWFITDSVSILATLIDSSLDVLASLVNLVAVRHALQPADREHRFGHGKAEALAGMGQAMFIAGSAVLLLLQAAGRMINPQPMSAGLEIGIGVMVFSMVATLALISYQQYVIKHTNSTAIKADRLHYKTDLLVNASVIVALLLTFYGWSGFDAVFAIGIALFILYSAWDIVKESIDLLMDHELPDEDRERIRAIVLKHPDTQGLHDLRTRRSGTMIFIQLHLELDSTLSLSAAHKIADQVERELSELFTDVEVIIHEDPVIVVLP